MLLAIGCTEYRASGLQVTEAEYTAMLLKTAWSTMLPQDVIMSFKE